MANVINEKEIGQAVSKEVAVDVNAVQEPTRSQTACTDEHPELAWQPGFKAQFPWTGFICILTVILCSIGAVIVLITSNNKSVDQWDSRVAPNVVLSILNNISSICITLAVGQGIAIAWWRKAIKGSTIKELHHSWYFSTSLKEIFLKYKYFNTIALAALMTKFAVIDGVLFQKSTTTYVFLSKPHNTNITTYTLDHFPNVTGTLAANSTEVQALTTVFTADMQNWIYSSPGLVNSPYGFFDCKGVCDAIAPGIGFSVNCSRTTTLVDIVADALAFANNSTNVTTTETDYFRVNFTTRFPTAAKNYSWIEGTLTNWYQTNWNATNATSQCPGNLYVETCEMRPAIIDYPVVMQFFNTSGNKKDLTNSQTNVRLGKIDENGTYDSSVLYNFDSDSMEQLEDFKIVRYIDIHDVGGPGNDTALAGFERALNEFYGSRAYMQTTSNDSNWLLYTEGQFASIMQTNAPEASSNPNADGCPYSFLDPVAPFVLGLNMLSFIVTDDPMHQPGFDDINSSDTNVWNQFTSAHSTQLLSQESVEKVHYHSNWGYMAGALASTFVCILCILPAYWGFWQLGRKVTLGPFEIANAFQAPVLANVNCGSGHAEEVLKAAGKSRVKYGEAYDEATGRNYRFDEHRS